MFPPQITELYTANPYNYKRPFFSALQITSRTIPFPIKVKNLK